MASGAVVSIRDLTFRHAGTDRPALRGVTLEVGAGEYLGIVGPNGAGKSTLALCCNGVVPQLLPGERSGSVEVLGRDPATTPVREMADLVGLVFDDPEAGLSQPTVADEVALGLESAGVSWSEMVDRVATAIAAVGLAGLEERSPQALSGGEQQRLAIACALVLRPPILVLDEPTANLDPEGRAAVLDLVDRLNRDAGVTVIMADHDVEALAERAGRIVVLDAGAIALDGPPARVFSRVAELDRIGVRVPQVTALAALLDRPGAGAGERGARERGVDVPVAAPLGDAEPPARGLPVTVDGALAWLAARAR